MSKHLHGIALDHRADYLYTSYFARLAPDITFDDLFRPQFWAHHYKKLNTDDVVRCKAADGSFDVTVTVVSKEEGGIVMGLWPKYPNADVVAHAARLSEGVEDARAELVVTKVHGKPVPRVEYTEGTKWRVIGLDGQTIVENLPSKKTADKRLDDILAKLGVNRPVEAA